MKFSEADMFRNSFVITSRPGEYGMFCDRMHAAGFVDMPRNYNGLTPRCLFTTTVHGVYCTMSHYNLVNMAMTLGLDHITVFEFDAFPCIGCAALLDDMFSRYEVPDDAEALSFGNLLFIRDTVGNGKDQCLDTIPAGSGYGLIKNPLWGTQAVVYFRRGIAKYLNNMRSLPAEKCICDQWWKYLDRVYHTRRSYFLQADSSGISYLDWIRDKDNLRDFPSIVQKK